MPVLPPGGITSSITLTLSLSSNTLALLPAVIARSWLATENGTATASRQRADVMDRFMEISRVGVAEWARGRALALDHASGETDHHPDGCRQAAACAAMATRSRNSRCAPRPTLQRMHH